MGWKNVHANDYKNKEKEAYYHYEKIRVRHFVNAAYHNKNHAIPHPGKCVL